MLIGVPAIKFFMFAIVVSKISLTASLLLNNLPVTAEEKTIFLIGSFRLTI